MVRAVARTLIGGGGGCLFINSCSARLVSFQIDKFEFNADDHSYHPASHNQKHTVLLYDKYGKYKACTEDYGLVWNMSEALLAVVFNPNDIAKSDPLT